MRHGHEFQKFWPRKHNDDPMATLHAWYCCACEKRHEPKYGMLVEMHRAGLGESTFARATVADEDVEDLGAMELQMRHGHANVTPEELYGVIPNVDP